MDALYGGDKQMGVNYHNEYGWWITNLDETTLEEYAEEFPEEYKKDIEGGMKLQVAPDPANYGFALYCTNYHECTGGSFIDKPKTIYKGR